MKPEKLELQSADGCQLNLDALYQIAPSCFTEAKGPDGKVRRMVNFDILRQLLGDAAADTGDEFYQFTWPGKAEARREAARPIKKTLRPIKDDSVDWDTTQNLYIEGDNLEVLKLLQKSYLGKVKMIYIDPPYNTGNDFVYNDDFALSADEYAEASGDIDELGLRYRKNTDSNGRFHSDWCSMIYPRLQIARTLLAEDGVIFISIDDNEVENLRKICDEVFGCDNFVAQIVWHQGRKSAGKTLAINHEYCLVFAKNLQNIMADDRHSYWRQRKLGIEDLYQKEKQLRQIYGDDLQKINSCYREYLKGLRPIDAAYPHKHYRCIDAVGIYFPSDASAPDKPETRSHTPLIHPVTGNPCAVPRSGWRYKEETLMEMYKKGLFHFGDSETHVPCVKTYLKNTETEIAQSVLYKDGRGATGRLNDLMGGKIFDFPKDENVIEDFLKMVVSDSKHSLILDFFSGSATTAHAVMQLNAEDDGKRRFIMVQLPEETEADSEARKAGYANICEIGKERIRRAGQKIKKEMQEKIWQLNRQSGTRFAIGDDCDKPTSLWQNLHSEEECTEMNSEAASIKQRLDNLDIGFRVFRVDESNMEDVYFAPKSYSQDKLDIFLDNVKADRTDLDLLFGAMLDWGVQLSLPMSTETVDGRNVYVVNEGDLVACFAEDITEEVIEFIADQSPLRVLLRDSCFSSDADKINIFEQFKQRLGWSDEEAYKNIRVL